jgi:hypothetical protein
LASTRAVTPSPSPSSNAQVPVQQGRAAVFLEAHRERAEQQALGDRGQH